MDAGSLCGDRSAAVTLTTTAARLPLDVEYHVLRSTEGGEDLHMDNSTCISFIEGDTAHPLNHLPFAGTVDLPGECIAKPAVHPAAAMLP